MEIVMSVAVIFLAIIVALWISTIFGLFQVSMQYKQINLLSMDKLFYKYLMSEGRVQFRNWLKKNNYVK